MEASLVAVLVNVIRPSDLASLFVEAIVNSGAGAYQNKIPDDRRGGEYSASGLEFP